MGNRLSRSLIGLLVALPVASLAINAIAWLRFGLDLPFFDDWRGYASGKIASLDPGYLFTPVNDTLTPVGFALDALAQRYLDGNPIPYQFLSMTIVLGGLLFFQWKLLLRVFDDKRLAAVCFVLTLLMLQPHSYWGRENLAYHQALPVLCILAALNLLFATEIRDRWRLPGLILLGLIAGLAYISGAIALLAVGIALVLVGFLSRSNLRKSLLSGGGALSLSGVVTAGLQLSALFSNPALTHRADAPLALPHEWDFWLFLLGKVGRSLLLPPERPVLSLVVVAFIVVLAVAVWGIFAARLIARHSMNDKEIRVAAIYIALAVAIFGYLMIVAAGRTNLRPEDVDSATEIFAYGFYRFHFFWATLLWPWLAAGCLVLLGAGQQGRSSRLFVPASLLSLVAIVLMFRGGAFKHVQAHSEEVRYRLPTISCLLSALQNGQGIFCSEFNMPDFSRAYAYGVTTGASFARHFPILPAKMRSDDPPPLFRFSRDAAQGELHDLAPASGRPSEFVAAADPWITLRTGRPDQMAKCSMLDVDAIIKPERADFAQLFYRPSGQADFAEHLSQRLALSEQPDVQRLSFRIESPTGFEDGLRFDPVTQRQRLEIVEIEVRCRLTAVVP